MEKREGINEGISKKYSTSYGIFIWQLYILRKTIADFFIHNTEEIDISSKNLSKTLFVSEGSISRFAKNVGLMDTDNLLTCTNKVLKKVLLI